MHLKQQPPRPPRRRRDGHRRDFNVFNRADREIPRYRRLNADPADSHVAHRHGSGTAVLTSLSWIGSVRMTVFSPVPPAALIYRNTT